MKPNINGEHIGVQLVDSQLNVLTQYNGNFGHIYDHLVKKIDGSSRYPFIGTIDPYSDTLYNSIQAPKLITELKQLANEDDNLELKEAIARLVEYLETISVHNYIRFLGD